MVLGTIKLHTFDWDIGFWRDSETKSNDSSKKYKNFCEILGSHWFGRRFMEMKNKKVSRNKKVWKQYANFLRKCFPFSVAGGHYSREGKGMDAQVFPLCFLMTVFLLFFGSADADFFFNYLFSCNFLILFLSLEFSKVLQCIEIWII